MPMATCQQRCYNINNHCCCWSWFPSVLAGSQLVKPVVGQQPLPQLPAAGGAPAAAAHPGGCHCFGACRR